MWKGKDDFVVSLQLYHSHLAIQQVTFAHKFINTTKDPSEMWVGGPMQKGYSATLQI